ncbi:hypothetical protein Syun_011485 [Stephania yunnanensis]|uniref:Uncharacterized protein n=1 Tax=Stephania yunnanensis TaxID=152371 RepID=A0AAP0JYN8_9MAGN
MFSQHGANSHSQCSGLVNISPPAAHSAGAKLKVLLTPAHMLFLHIFNSDFPSLLLEMGCRWTCS